MKKTDFITTIQKMITDRQEKLASLDREIESLKHTISEQEKNIDEFIDLDNVEAYTKLKESLAMSKNKLELLEKNRKAETSAVNEAKFMEIYHAFQNEYAEIDRKCEADIIPEVKAIQKAYDESIAARDELTRLYETWRSVYKAPADFSYPHPGMTDITGAKATVSRMINTFKSAGKI